MFKRIKYIVVSLRLREYSLRIIVMSLRLREHGYVINQQCPHELHLIGQHIPKSW